MTISLSSRKVSWFTKQEGDDLTKEQMRLVWNREKEEDILIEEENEHWDEKFEVEERRPLLSSAADNSWFTRLNDIPQVRRRQMKVGLSIFLVICIYSIEFIFR